MACCLAALHAQPGGYCAIAAATASMSAVPLSDSTWPAICVGRPALCAGATVIPVAIGPEDTGQVVQTVAVFSGRLAQGLAAAQSLAARLRAGSLNAVLDERRFGRVHIEALSQPFLVSAQPLPRLLRWCPSSLATLPTRYAGSHEDGTSAPEPLLECWPAAAPGGTACQR